MPYTIHTGRRWLAASTLALIAVMVTVLAIAAKPPELASVRLADGSRVTLLAIADGSKTIEVGSPLQRLLRAVLPNQLKERSGAWVFHSGTSASRTFLLRWDVGTLGDCKLTTFDELGNEAPLELTHTVGTSAAVTFLAQAFPRRGRIAGVRFYRQQSAATTVNPVGGWRSVGELQVLNPSPPATRRWVPESLATSATVGDLDVSLTGLEFGGNAAKGSSLNLLPGEVPARATVRITRRGRIAPGWGCRIRSLSDPYGNTWPVVPADILTKDAAAQFLFAAPALHDREAWRFQVEVYRDETASYSSEETWTLKGLPVPTPGQVIPIGRKKQLRGDTWELVEIYGPRMRLPAPIEGLAENDFYRNRYSAVFRISRPEPDVMFPMPLEVYADRDRPVDFFQTHWMHHPDHTVSVHRMDVPKGARTVTMVFGVQQSRLVQLAVPRNPVAR